MLIKDAGRIVLRFELFVSGHRKMDNRFQARRHILQPWIVDQGPHLPAGEARGLSTSLWPAQATSTLEVGERDHAEQAGQRHDPEMDAAV